LGPTGPSVIDTGAGGAVGAATAAVGALTAALVG
jgi:hypothetical protein